MSLGVRLPWARRVQAGETVFGWLDFGWQSALAFMPCHPAWLRDPLALPSPVATRRRQLGGERLDMRDQLFEAFPMSTYPHVIVTPDGALCYTYSLESSPGLAFFIS